MPRKAKSRIRRSSEQVQELLGQVASMRKAGEPLMKALEKVGISYSNYNYWVKKRGGGASAGRGRGRGAGAARGGVMVIIEEIRKNREERQKLEQQLRALDSRFNQLRARLAKS